MSVPGRNRPSSGVDAVLKRERPVVLFGRELPLVEAWAAMAIVSAIVADWIGAPQREHLSVVTDAFPHVVH
jgi:hypothetical protein